MQNGQTGGEIRIQPIAPKDVIAEKEQLIPEIVINTFNTLIAQNIRNGSARILQETVVLQLEEENMKRQDIYGKHMLDVEDIYREAGWKVEYDKPGFNEFYKASFTFKAP